MAVGESDTNEAETEGLSDVLDAFDVDTADEVAEENDTGSSDDAVAAVDTILADLDEPVSTWEDEALEHDAGDAVATGDDDALADLDGAFADFEAGTGTAATVGTDDSPERAGLTLVRVPNEAFGSALVAERTSQDDYETAHDEFKALAEEMDADGVDVDDLDLSDLTLGESVPVSQLVDDLPESDAEDTRFVWVSF